MVLSVHYLGTLCDTYSVYATLLLGNGFDIKEIFVSTQEFWEINWTQSFSKSHRKHSRDILRQNKWENFSHIIFQQRCFSPHLFLEVSSLCQWWYSTMWLTFIRSIQQFLTIQFCYVSILLLEKRKKRRLSSCLFFNLHCRFHWLWFSR